MPLFTIIISFKEDLYKKQINASDQYDAFRKCAPDLIRRNFFGDRVTKNPLIKAVEEKLSSEGTNLWMMWLLIYGSKAMIHIVATEVKEVPSFDFDKATEFIWEKLSDESKTNINLEDVDLILELETQYMKEIGIAKKYGDNYLVDGDKSDEIDDEEQVKFISINALKKKKNYSNDIIEEVLDLEWEYMDKNGFLENPVVRYMGIDFDAGSEN